MLEEERKYQAGAGFELPDLTDQLPTGAALDAVKPVTLTATYYDTADLRLARAGVSLRHRRGDALPWTVKLPADVPGVRREISRAGRAGTPPKDLVALVTAYSRGEPLAPAAVVRSVRRAYEVRADGQVLAEIADDDVAVLDGKTVRSKFREIEVERKEGDRGLLERLGGAIVRAGAVEGAFTPKHVRALGPAAAAAPDLVTDDSLPDAPTSGDVVTAALRRDIGRIFAHDPLVRLAVPTDEGDTAVHQMRVGCRRMRSDLRTFDPLLDRPWADGLRAELSWIAGVLGAARDAEVLRERLRRTASTDPVAPPDEESVAKIDAELAHRHERALVAVDEAMRTPRYHALLDALVDAAREPRLSTRAMTPADDLLPRLVSRPWHRLAYGAKGVDGAADLDPSAPDERWHAVRINGKKARYAVDAAAPVIGRPAEKLAKALGRVQTLLGEHQDAAVAADTWVDVARTHPDDLMLAVTAGRLYERERASIREVRSAFPDAWRRAAAPQRTAWLP
jgi:CHAD domain-containing protein